MRRSPFLFAASALALVPALPAAAQGRPSPEEIIGDVDGRPQSAALITARCERLVRIADQYREALEKDTAPVSLDTLRRYDDINILLWGINGRFVQEVAATKEARDAGGACSDKSQAAGSRLSLSRPIYDKLKALSAQPLDEKTAYILARELGDYERSGINLDEAGRARVQALNEEISKLSTDFSAAIAEDKTTVLADPAELEGVPADFLASHKPGKDGKVVLTLDYTDLFPVYLYAKSEDLRRRMYTAFNRKAFPKNDATLSQLIDKRDELAKLVGRRNYAELTLENRMAQSPEKVQAFLDDLVAAADPAAQRDIARKLAVLGSAGPLLPWNSNYAGEIVQKRDFGYDSQEARKYFAFDKVQAGILKLSEDLFGVTIRRWDTPVWDKSVHAFEMLDGDTPIGRFYFDLHPRPGKYSHANAVPLRPGVDGRIIPTAALVMNVPGGDGSEGLMQFDDVSTFLHEYGHLLHLIFGGQKKAFSLRSGVATEWDFVEAPSQMLENWIYDYDTLASFATDRDGKPIPRALVAAMNKARYFDAGLLDQKQSALANVSLGYYLGKAPDNLGKRYRELQARYDPLPVPEISEGQDSFGHLTSYGPAYYTYLWSKVIADDLNSRFEKEGLRNRRTAEEYRRLVLEPGGEKPAAKLIEDFLGRPFNAEAHQRMLELDR